MPAKTRKARFEARVPAGVRALIRRAASIEGRSMTDFVFDAAQAAARRAIADADVVRLSEEDRRRFAESLIRPSAPARALGRAFQRRAKLLGAG